ncbi:hypothetical protein [Photobacterium phosphoreum]|nr:hypothetical protein [Photobacterium phosphoreum]
MIVDSGGGVDIMVAIEPACSGSIMLTVMLIIIKDAITSNAPW